jgi:hypothetical protein
MPAVTLQIETTTFYVTSTVTNLGYWNNYGDVFGYMSPTTGSEWVGTIRAIYTRSGSTFPFPVTVLEFNDDQRGYTSNYVVTYAGQAYTFEHRTRSFDGTSYWIVPESVFTYLDSGSTLTIERTFSGGSNGGGGQIIGNVYYGLQIFSATNRLVYSSTDVTWNQVDFFTVSGYGYASRSYSVLSNREVLVVQILINGPPTNRRAYAHSISFSGTTVTVSGGSESAFILVLMR